MASYLRPLNDELVKQAATICGKMFRPNDSRVTDNNSGDNAHTVNSVESAISVLERGLAVNLEHLEVVTRAVENRSKAINRMRVVLSRRRDLANLARALLIERLTHLAVRREAVHAALSVTAHLHFLNVCKNRLEMTSFKEEVAWKWQFDRVIAVVKEELIGAERALSGIAKEEEWLRS